MSAQVVTRLDTEVLMYPVRTGIKRERAYEPGKSHSEARLPVCSGCVYA